MHRLMLLLGLFALAASASAAQEERKIFRVDFTKNLDVDGLNPESYANFIKELRRDLAVQYSHGVAVLPVDNPLTYDPRAFDVKLRCGARETTVRMHRDSLVLVGFQSQSDQRWFEFRHQDSAQRIEGSEYLGFDNTYADLSKVAHQDILDMSFNKNALRDAVSKLASSKNSQDRAYGLIVVSQMIIEASRFVDISNHFAPNIESGEPVRLPVWMLDDLVPNWSSFSYIVLKSDADPCFQFVPQTVHGQKIDNVDDLRKLLGIIRRDPDTILPPCSPSPLYSTMKKFLAFQARNLL